MSTLGQLFKQKLLAEKEVAMSAELLAEAKAKKDAAEHEAHDAEFDEMHDAMPEEMKKLTAAFPTRGAKAVAMLMSALGVPATAMLLKKTELRKSVMGAADMWTHNFPVKMWSKKVLEKLTSLQAAPVAESALVFSTDKQRLVYALLQALGMTEGVERAAKRTIRQNVMAIAELMQQDSNLFTFIKMLAKAMGVTLKTEVAAEAQEIEVSKEELFLAEDAAIWDTAKPLMDILAHFGITRDNFKAQNMVASELARHRTLLQNGSIVRLMGRLEAELAKRDKSSDKEDETPQI